MSVPTALSFGEPWIAGYFAEVDNMHPMGLVRWYTADGTFRFANQPPVQGHPAITATLAGFYQSIKSMRHERTGVWLDLRHQSGVFEAVVHFETLNDRKVAIPAVSVLRLKDGLIHDFRFVMDAAPLTGGSHG